MFDIYRVSVASYDANRFMGLQLEADGSHPFVEAVFPLGTVARPDDAAENEPGCSALGFEDGSDVYAMPITDPRVLPGQPQCKPGGWASYAPTARLQTFLAFDGANGGVTLYARDGAAGPEAKAHSLNFDNTTHSVYLQQADGAAVVLTPTDAVLRGPGGASLTASDGLVAFGGLSVTGALSQPGGAPVVPVAQLLPVLNALVEVLTAHEVAMGLNVPTIVPTMLGTTLEPLIAAIVGTLKTSLA
jgi:hypothetical protein